MKIAFFDRNGTVIKDYKDQEWARVVEPEFLPEAFENLRAVRKLGYEIIFISNQSLINEGIISEKQFSETNGIFLNRLQEEGIDVLDFFYCSHTNQENCNCKKPRPGLILEALLKYPEIDLKASFYVGDSEADIGIAKYFKLKMFYLGGDMQERVAQSIHPISHLKELVEALKR